MADTTEDTMTAITQDIAVTTIQDHIPTDIHTIRARIIITQDIRLAIIIVQIIGMLLITPMTMVSI